MPWAAERARHGRAKRRNHVLTDHIRADLVGDMVDATGCAGPARQAMAPGDRWGALMSDIQVFERDDFYPVCPYCDREINSLIARKLSASVLTRRMVYCCPQCRKVLGISHRKGLLTG